MMLNQQGKKTLAQWLAHFESLHDVRIDMGLSRAKSVWIRLCTTYAITELARQKVISVSGTNGKGSTCQMLSLLLAKRDSTVGIYTSPHIHHFSERVQIDHRPASEALLVKAFEAVEVARDNISLTYFEATTLVALLIFAWKKVDYAILEVGLGGRLDAVNSIDADAAILTSVGLDHQAFLGSDLEGIAWEKSGIFRPHKPAIYAQTHCYDKVLAHASSQAVFLLVNGKDYQCGGNRLYFRGKDYEMPDNIVYLGQHQCQNAAAVMVLLVYWGLLPDDYQQRLQSFALPGRLQYLQRSPDIVVDVAHNVAAASALADYICKQGQKGKRYALIGMLKDKDHVAVLSVFTGVFDEIFFVSTEGDRGYSGKKLQEKWQKLSATPAVAYSAPQEALRVLKQRLHGDDSVYAFGSFGVATELIKT